MFHYRTEMICAVCGLKRSGKNLKHPETDTLPVGELKHSGNLLKNR
jgi:hypothetical protein